MSYITTQEIERYDKKGTIPFRATKVIQRYRGKKKQCPISTWEIQIYDDKKEPHST